MRVLFITRKFPPSVGGMERFAYDLSKALGSKVDLRLVKWGRSGRIKAVILGLPYLAIRAFAILLRGGVDVVHAHDGVVAPVGYLLARLFRKPFVVVIHGLDMTYRNPLFKMTVPAAVRRADAVICISQATADEVKSHGVAEDKIHIIPLAVRDELQGGSYRTELINRLDLPANAQVLLTVGRLVKRKGAAWFIENVLPGLVAEHAGLVYLLVGEGEERRHIEQTIRRTHLDAHVRLLGKADDELYKAAYNGADVFVMPNIEVPGDIEGFGLVLLEASLCKLPIVAAGIEGIVDAVTDGKNGVLVPSGDVPAFQEQIARFLKDKKTAAAFGVAARHFTLENYRWDKLSEGYVAIYKKLLTSA